MVLIRHIDSDDVSSSVNEIDRLCNDINGVDLSACLNYTVMKMDSYGVEFNRIKCAYVEIIEKLLDRGARCSRVLTCIRTANLKTVKRLMENGALFGFDALVSAVQFNQLREVLEFICDRLNFTVLSQTEANILIDLSISSTVGDSCLVVDKIVKECGHLKIEEYFMKSALEKNRLDIARVFMKNDIVTDYSKYKQEYNDKLLCMLCRSTPERVDLICKVIAAGASMQYVDDQLTTALGYAILSNHPESIVFLIENGADINEKCYQLDTPLVLAVKLKNTQLITYLLQRGADIDKNIYITKESVGYFDLKDGIYTATALFFAIVKKQYNIAKILLAHGPKQFFVRTPYAKISLLTLSIYLREYCIIDLLLQHGCSVNEDTADIIRVGGQICSCITTPIKLAVKLDNLSIVMLLKSRGATTPDDFDDVRNSCTDYLSTTDLEEQRQVEFADNVIIY